jgi:LPS sulfotransferase NodH
MILSTPRSGSSLFYELLQSLTFVDCVSEWLNDDMIRAYAGVMNRSQVSVADYWRFVQAKATSPEGVFAVKVHVRDFFKMVEHGVDIFAKGLDGVYFVHRRDKLAQAMSLAKAKASGQWHDSHRTQRVVAADDISNGDIVQALQEIAEQEDRYRAAFSGRVRREFVYEEFSTQPELVGSVCEDLQLPVRNRLPDAPTSVVQRTAADMERLVLLRQYLGIG